MRRFSGAQQWDDYLQLFANSVSSLAKLRPEVNPNEDADVAAKNFARAYLMGNGNCGAESPMGTPLSFGVGAPLD